MATELLGIDVMINQISFQISLIIGPSFSEAVKSRATGVSLPTPEAHRRKPAVFTGSTDVERNCQWTDISGGL